MKEKIKYPTLPIDSQKVIQYRTLCQKPKEKEEVWSWYFLRRISIYISIFLSKTNITPNTISWLSFIFFVITGIFIIMGTPIYYLLSVITYNIGYMFDCIDGEIARIKNLTSKQGLFLDTLIRATSIPLIVALFMSIISKDDLSNILALSIYLLSTISTLALLVPLSFTLTLSDDLKEDPVSSMRTKSALNEWIAFFSGFPGFFFVLLILAIVDLIFKQKFITVYISLFLLQFILKTILRTLITVKRLTKIDKGDV